MKPGRTRYRSNSNKLKPSNIKGIRVFMYAKLLYLYFRYTYAMRKRTLLLTAIASLFFINATAQNNAFPPLLDSASATALTDSLQTLLADGVMRISNIRIRDIQRDDRHQHITFNFTAGMAEYPIRKEKTERVFETIRHFLPGSYRHYTLRIRTDNRDLEELIPEYFNPGFTPLSKDRLDKNRKDYEKAVAINKRSPAKINPKRGTPQEIALQTKLENRQAAINLEKLEAQAQMKRDERRNRRHDWPDLGPTPLVTRENRPYNITHGLQNRHIALWHSHGLYYEQKLARWEWQRARLFQTVEDLYTMSYVLPFLTPMLENAGAIVMLPRERDTQINEVVVDNDDAESGYSEQGGTYLWRTDEKDNRGFANKKEIYTCYDNPFRMGTYRRIVTHNPELNKKAVMQPAFAEWIPDIPEAGEYAVYVSYASLPLSARDARYTVHHKGGSEVFRVNQQMGGGTWIYLGTFSFDEGRNVAGRVTLSNESREVNAIVTADAVKFGGGMGNMGRMVQDTSLVSHFGNISFPPQISGYPRFTEGARYWLQYAGFSDTVYTYYEGDNDYTDDYSSRGRWVNTLAGGSEKHPGNPGLKIPVDLSFSFHTDAGVTKNDSIIGTLAIYTRDSDGTEFLPTGHSRLTSRDYTDLVQTQIVNDLRALWNPDWTRRGIWNRSYSESRSPQIPAMLLELLSHQNFADMRYGLDPLFRFTVSRAIYKGMLRYLSSTAGFEYVVQPLPVNRIAVNFNDSGNALLTWEPTEDLLEPTARARGYIVYTRKGGRTESFDSGTYVEANRAEVPVEPGRHYSFRVTAVNSGGESFPSQVVSLFKVPEGDEKGKILIVNGFTRISAPDSYASHDTLYAGFTDHSDHGVPYIKDISYTGSQFEFRRKYNWSDDDAPGFGASHADWETRVIPGNTFDYPIIHGDAFASAGYSYVSCGVDAFSDPDSPVEPEGFFAVDLILGKQKQVHRGGIPSGRADFRAFPPALQVKLTQYARQQGNLLISGSYVSSDIWGGVLKDSLSERFATDILKIRHRTNQAARKGEVITAPSPFTAFYDGKPADQAVYTFQATLNDIVYAVESPDAFEPAGEGAFTIFRYRENRLGAGVAYKGDHASVVLGFPLETLQEKEQLERLVKQCLDFFNTDK